MIEFEKGFYSYAHTVSTPKIGAYHRHMHNTYEILYFLQGDAEYIIESSVYRLKPRDLLLIRPRSFHYLSPLSDATYERFVIQFPADKIPASCIEFAESAKEIYRVPNGSPVDRLFESWSEAETLLSENEMKEFLYSTVTHIMLYLRHLTEESEAEPVRENPILENILRYIDTNPTERFTASALAAKFFVSTSWLTHTFRQNLGVSLGEYSEKKRILFAEACIREGKSPTDASKLCGYDNYSTFYRQYKKILGRTPRDDEKRLR